MKKYMTPRHRILSAVIGTAGIVFLALFGKSAVDSHMEARKAHEIQGVMNFSGLENALSKGLKKGNRVRFVSKTNSKIYTYEGNDGNDYRFKDANGRIYYGELKKKGCEIEAIDLGN
jgi:hypothetical protein